MLHYALLVTYLIGPGVSNMYEVDVEFNGFLPVLGGRVGKASVAMQVEVKGLTPTVSGNPRASSEIKSLQLMFNKAVMPFGPANVQEFFPKTTIEFTKFGRMLATDAPDVKLPVRLPGLDVKRFPDITYLPIEFPEVGLEIGKTFKFKKPFGDAEVTYEVTPTQVEGDISHLTIKVDQHFNSFEDEHHNPVVEDQAAVKISTDVVGEGKADFDLHKGILSILELKATASSHVQNLKTLATSDRKLETGLKVSLHNTDK